MLKLKLDKIEGLRLERINPVEKFNVYYEYIVNEPSGVTTI